MDRIDFFIIGTQKGGTTSLHNKLRQVNGIQMPKSKELHFFDNESINWDQPDYTKLHSYFNWNVECKARGEATPIYCFWPYSIHRIFEYNPKAKLIMILRHPVFRAYSQWKMEFQRCAETLSFADAISEKGCIRFLEKKVKVHRIYSYVERGFYSGQVKQILNIFPPEQVLFLLTDDLWVKPQEVYNQILNFIGVVGVSEITSKYITPNTPKTVHIPIQQDLLDVFNKLKNLYHEDIIQTETLTGISLSSWLDPSYVEPMIKTA